MCRRTATAKSSRRRVLADGRPPDQAHQARRQRPRDDARRIAVQALCRAGQCRPGRGHRYVAPTGSSRRIDARAPLRACSPAAKYTGAATSRGDAVSGRQHTLRREQRSELHRRHPAEGRKANAVSGLIPTAYEPHDITFSADGSWMYIISGKSVTGPNPGHLAGNTANITSIIYPGGNAAAAAAARASNQYQFQLERASLVSAPVPTSGHLRTSPNRSRRTTSTRPRPTTKMRG